MTFHKRLCAIAMGLFFSGQAGWASADTASDTEELLNWAESAHPSFFTPRSTTITSPPWLYRFYSGAGIYAGVNTDNHNVYALGGAFGNENPVFSVCPKTPFSSLACLFFNRLI